MKICPKGSIIYCSNCGVELFVTIQDIEQSEVINAQDVEPIYPQPKPGQNINHCLNCGANLHINVKESR